MVPTAASDEQRLLSKAAEMVGLRQACRWANAGQLSTPVQRRDERVGEKPGANSRTPLRLGLR